MTRRDRIAASDIRVVAAVFAAIVFLVSATAGVQAQTLTVLHTFLGTDGSHPYAGITMDPQGNLYGVTAYGGLQNCDLGGAVGCGVAFNLTKENSNWAFSLLYEFGANGSLPTYPSQIVLGPNGTPYGAELEGGIGGSSFQGTVYNLLPPQPAASATVNSFWTYTLLHLFGNGDDGTYPHKIIFDGSGNIFGATGRGGTFNSGTVYELSPSGQNWTENILYNFGGGADGLIPLQVVSDGAGNLYGVTEQGGNPGCSPFQGCGTIFELTPSGSGWTKTILHAFDQNSDGGYPGPLMRDGSGNLFGLTMQNGPNNYGTIWELSPSDGGWIFKVLYSFGDVTVAILGPFAPVMDASGALYGVNNSGGTNNCGGNMREPCGYIYKLTPSGDHWVYTDLHDFAFDNSGCLPVGPVALDAAGNIYGATYGCGAGGGTVFKFTQAPMAQSAFSRKTHGGAGTFDIPLPLTGNVGIECRSGGATNDYQTIITFATTVTVGSASVTSGTGSVSSFSVSGSQVTVNLTGVTDAQIITVTLFNVNDGTNMDNVPVSMGVLVGDVNGNAVVNASDVSLTKSQVGQPVSGSNFREDVNANGTISSTDVALVKFDVGTALPP